MSNFSSLTGLELHLRTIPGRVGWVQGDYTAISVQLKLQLPTGTELGKILGWVVGNKKMCLLFLKPNFMFNFGLCWTIPHCFVAIVCTSNIEHLINTNKKVVQSDPWTSQKVKWTFEGQNVSSVRVKRTLWSLEKAYLKKLLIFREVENLNDLKISQNS